jgi:hypothetical protein
VKLRLDKFTIVVLAIVGVLLAAALVTVYWSGSSRQAAEYRTDNAPETPVHNAFLALRKGDMVKAREQYSAKVLKDVDTQEGYYGPLRGSYYSDQTARRLRILKSELDPKNPDRAYVTAAVDTYAGGGLFDSGSTWSSERVVEVVREDGVWKINTQEYFY